MFIIVKLSGFTSSTDEQNEKIALKLNHLFSCETGT